MGMRRGGGDGVKNLLVVLLHALRAPPDGEVAKLLEVLLVHDVKVTGYGLEVKAFNFP